MGKNGENKQKEKRREKMSSTYKVAMITAVTTLLFIAILLLLILFGVKKCQGNNQKTSTPSEQPIDTETNAKINKSFLDIVKTQLDLDGYDMDELKSVVTVTYEENYPTKFSLNVVASSDTKMYYYSASDVNYPENKDGYNNFVSYLLGYDTNQMLDGDVDLALLDKTNDTINTSKTSCKAVVSKDASDNKYLSGFTYEDNSFFVYQKRLLSEGAEPFAGVGNQKIDSTSPLFDYYRGLLAT